MKFYDFPLNLLQTIWKNIEKERNTGMSKLMRFYGTPGIPCYFHIERTRSARTWDEFRQVIRVRSWRWDEPCTATNTTSRLSCWSSFGRGASFVVTPLNVINCPGRRKWYFSWRMRENKPLHGLIIVMLTTVVIVKCSWSGLLKWTLSFWSFQSALFLASFRQFTNNCL